MPGRAPALAFIRAIGVNTGLANPHAMIPSLTAIMRRMCSAM
jgi:hypothetical protein